MSEMLRPRLLGALPEAVRTRVEAHADLDGWLAESQGQITALGLPIDEALLVEALTAALTVVEPTDLHPADLYLAAQCARGHHGALRRFQADYGPDLDRAIRKSPTLGLTADEFRQRVFDRLFVREGEAPPRIDKYSGRGSLRSWVRVMASRYIIDLSRRRDRSTASDEGLAEKIGAAEDTEIDYLRHAYGPALDTAFEHAVAALTVRERNLLRQRYLHDVSADTLAKIYGVHRSTVFAWLDKARLALLGHVRSGLAQNLPGDQLESVVGMLGSKLQLSVRRMLDSRLEDEPK
ncbi:MAG: sigma-70 family RNA polymerase sigma factor [Myxococcota bacterium]